MQRIAENEAENATFGLPIKDRPGNDCFQYIPDL